MKRLIVNADDFGQDADTLTRTIEGFELGKISSATIMAGMPETVRAVEYAKAHPQFSFGVHLCLVDEKPISDPKDIPSMVDPKTGRLWLTRQFILRNFAGLVSVDDIQREMSSQIDALKALGLKISHLDGHGHNHRLPQSLKALERVMSDYGIKKVRRCQDLFVGKPGLLSKLINGPMQRRMNRAGMVITDHFAMNAGKVMDVNWFRDLVARIDGGITEIGIHPGFNEEWRRMDCEGCYAYDFSNVELANFDEI